MNLATVKTTAAITNTECEQCRSQHRRFLHHVRLRGVQRLLCTSCVLSLHPASFCPSCFQVYDATSPSSPNPPPHPSKRITCVKCSSISHSQCVSTSHVSTSSPYFCPPCANPNFSFFDVDSNNEKRGFDRAIDKKLSLVLLCATRIASSSMSKAVIVAKVDAERRVKEAAVARKRAREAIDHVAFVANKEKARSKERSVEVSGAGNVGKEKTLNHCQNLGGVSKVVNSREASANLSHVGLKVKEGIDGLKGPNAMLASQKKVVTLGAEERDKQSEKKSKYSDNLGSVVKGLNSCQASANLRDVGLQVKEGIDGSKGPNVRLASQMNVPTVDVEEGDKKKEKNLNSSLNLCGVVKVVNSCEALAKTCEVGLDVKEGIDGLMGPNVMPKSPMNVLVVGAEEVNKQTEKNLNYSQDRVVKLENSCEASANLSNVPLKVKEGIDGFKEPNVMSASPKNVVTVGAEEGDEQSEKNVDNSQNSGREVITVNSSEALTNLSDVGLKIEEGIIDGFKGPNGMSVSPKNVATVSEDGEKQNAAPANSENNGALDDQEMINNMTNLENNNEEIQHLPKSDGMDEDISAE